MCNEPPEGFNFRPIDIHQFIPLVWEDEDASQKPPASKPIESPRNEVHQIPEVSGPPNSTIRDNPPQAPQGENPDKSIEPARGLRIAECEFGQKVIDYQPQGSLSWDDDA